MQDTKKVISFQTYYKRNEFQLVNVSFFLVFLSFFLFTFSYVFCKCNIRSVPLNISVNCEGMYHVPHGCTSLIQMTKYQQYKLFHHKSN